MNGRIWTAAELAELQAIYPHRSTKLVAQLLRRPLCSVYNAAYKLGLRKTPAYLASAEACRLRRGDQVGAAFRFPPGHVPANKGTRRPGWAPGRMAETQFRPGERRGKAAQNWCPIGTILTDSDGYRRIKIREGRQGEAYGFGNTKIWPLLQRHVWEQHCGPIPPGHAVVFRDGDRSHCEIGNLELVSRRELMARNSVHNLPKELVDVIQLNGALKRKIRRLLNAEQDAGPAQPPVCHPGSPQ
ncbi:MAG: HNH endonuclease signature motif containing protein [Bryobacteraceae bacterium]